MEQQIRIKEQAQPVLEMTASRANLPHQILALKEHLKFLETVSDRKIELPHLYFNDAALALNKAMDQYPAVKKESNFEIPGFGQVYTVFVIDDKYRIQIEPTKTLNTILWLTRKNADKDFDETILEMFNNIESFYKGKCLRAEVYQAFFGHAVHAKEMTLKNEELIFNSGIEQYLKIVFYAMKQQSKKILLYGDYGTGKSALLPVFHKETGFTTIYANTLTTEIRNFAKFFAPSIVFIEDIEKHQGSTLDLILDGVDTKNDNVSYVFTSNHPEKLEERLTRAGRIDFHLHVTAPNAETVGRFLELYGIDPSPGLTDVLEGQNPSNIKEVCDRLKIAYEIPDIVVTDDLLIEMASGAINERKFVDESKPNLSRIGEKVMEFYDISPDAMKEMATNGKVVKVTQ